MDKVRVWLIGGSNEVNPDDLARAIREEIEAYHRRQVCSKCMGKKEVCDTGCILAPREPAQERQEQAGGRHVSARLASNQPGRCLARGRGACAVGA